METLAGNEFEIVCEGAVAGGRMLARRDGKIVLVAGALPGERVVARVTKDTKSLAEAEAADILEPSAGRRTPPCPVAATCGGCDFQHASRELQLEMKRAIVADAFRRIAKIDVAALLEGPRPAVPEFGARTRIRLTYDPLGRPGLLKRASHDVVPIEDCPLMTRSFGAAVLPWMRLLPPWAKGAARFGADGNAVVLLESKGGPNGADHRRLVKTTKEMERPAEVLGVVGDGIPVAGSRELVYEVRGHTLRVDAGSFFQASTEGAAELVRVAEDLLGVDRRGLLIDAYAGCGLFAATLGGSFERVVASDADAGAVKMLRRNLDANGVSGEARTEEAQVTLRKAERSDSETVILDPPRTGMEKVARAALLERRPARILAISCDPATGARDAAAVVAAGYRLERLVALDLFPVTAHVETAALLVRGESRVASPSPGD